MCFSIDSFFFLAKRQNNFSDGEEGFIMQEHRSPLMFLPVGAEIK